MHSNRASKRGGSGRSSRIKNQKTFRWIFEEIPRGNFQDNLVKRCHKVRLSITQWLICFWALEGMVRPQIKRMKLRIGHQNGNRF